MNLRAIAAQVICRVLDGASLADALPETSKKIRDPRDQALLQALCYGVCRWFFRLDAILANLLEKPLKEKDQDIAVLLMVGLYQLSEMRIPAHAAVAETVDAVEGFNKPWAKGLVNAVLRNYQRHAAELSEQLLEDDEANYAHPEWILEKTAENWPEDWQEILTANNQHPPLALRVNQQLISRKDYLAKLAEENIEADEIPDTTTGIVLKKPMDVLQLPGFSQGEISVQDGAAQLVAKLLALAPGQRVLDACAAPGGKTAHMLEEEPKLQEVVAIDQDPTRLNLVKENLQRLKLSATCICADAGDRTAWWDGKLFDRILLDAPCSASGVIRRHPDIKLLRREEDVAALAKEQLRLLTSLWPLLTTDGMLVYATCSIFKDENDDVLDAFLAAHPDAKIEKINADWGRPCLIGRQVLPSMHDMDGFYFASLRKSTLI